MAKRREKGEGCLRQIGSTWYAQWYDPITGKQVQRTTGTTIKQEAIGKLREFMNARDKGLPVVNPKLTYAALRRTLLGSYLDRGNKSLRVNADGEESIVGLPQLDAFCGYVPAKDGQPGNPGPQVARLTEDFVEAFKEKRRAEDAGPAMSQVCGTVGRAAQLPAPADYLPVLVRSTLGRSGTNPVGAGYACRGAATHTAGRGTNQIGRGAHCATARRAG